MIGRRGGRVEDRKEYQHTGSEEGYCIEKPTESLQRHIRFPAAQRLIEAKVPSSMQKLSAQMCDRHNK